MEETPQAKSKKLKSKPKPSLKRGTEAELSPQDSKRVKGMEIDEEKVVEKSEDVKKQLFQRVWSDEDEIAVLEGLIVFRNKKGMDPAKNMTDFHEFVRNSLHFDASLTQLKDKVAKLRKRMEKNLTMGNSKISTKPHDQKALDLARKIWGSEAPMRYGTESSLKSNGKAKKSGAGGKNHRDKQKDLNNLNESKEEAQEKQASTEVDHVEKNSGRDNSLRLDKIAFAGVTGMDEYVLKRGLDMVDGSKKAEMERKWKALHVAELELFLQRNELIMEQAKLMLDAGNDNNDN